MRRLQCYLLLFCPIFGFSTDTLTVGQCRKLAEQQSPLQQKKAAAENAAALHLRNIKSNSLPRISAGAQATWQSDVFGLPINSPLFEVPIVPKDQYKLNVEVAERLYDGGSDKVLRQQRELERDLAKAQTDVDVFQVRELVTDLYFRILHLQETENVLVASKKDLDTRLAQAKAMVNEGVALRTVADQIQVQILKTEQQTDAVKSDKYALKKMLGLWIGREDFEVGSILPGPKSQMSPPENFSARPEFRVLDLQNANLQIAKNGLALKTKPKVEAFAQGGLGRPNPFNFFETGFEPFFMFGLRAAWSPFDWGNRKRDAQVFDLQAINLSAQRQALNQKLEIQNAKDWADAEKFAAQLRQDDQIISLQEDILKRADAQVKNGVMTMTDFLAQQNLLTQARISRKTHEIQAVEAREKALVRIGN